MWLTSTSKVLCDTFFRTQYYIYISHFKVPEFVRVLEINHKDNSNFVSSCQSYLTLLLSYDRIPFLLFEIAPFADIFQSVN